VNKIKENPLIKKLLSLNLPTDDYAVFGSGPLYAHNIIKKPRDLDVLARGEAWKKALKLGKLEKLPLGSRAVRLFNGRVEIVNTWVPGKWDVDELIDTAEIIEGIRFVKLENVLKWKRKMGRPKDLKHIKMIEKYIAGKGKPNLTAQWTKKD